MYCHNCKLQKKKLKVTLVNPFLINDERMTNNDTQYLFSLQATSTLFAIVAVLSTFIDGLLSLFWPKKNLWPKLFVKRGSDYFLFRCLSKFDHGKISQIQVPLSNSGPLSTCLLLEIKIFAAFVWQRYYSYFDYLLY